MFVAAIMLCGVAGIASALPFSAYPLWSTAVGYSTSTPVVAGNFVFVTPRSDGSEGFAPFDVIALNKGEGTVVWNVSSSFSQTLRDPRGSCGYAGPAEPDRTGRVAIGFRGQPTVRVLNVLTGLVEWIHTFDVGVDHVSGWNDRFFVAVQTSIVCLNATSGDVLWTSQYRYNENDDEVRQISVHDNRVGIFISQGTVIGLDVYNGGALYATRSSPGGWTNNFYGTAVVRDGMIAVQGFATATSLTSNNSTLAVFDANSGAKFMQAIFQNEDVGPAPAVGAGGVAAYLPAGYISGHKDVITAYNVSTGAALWAAPFYWYVHSATACTDVVVATVTVHEMDFSDQLIGFDAATGSVKWTVPSPFSRNAPVYQSGILYGGSGTFDESNAGSVTAVQVEPSS